MVVIMKKRFLDVFPFVLFILFSLVAGSQSVVGSCLADFESLSKREQVKLLEELCWQNREKQSDKAIEYGLRGIKIAEQEGFQKDMGVLYNYVGVIYQHYKDDIHTAINYYNLGLPIILQEKDSVEIAYVYNNLGDAFYHTGNEALAVEYAQKSMEIFERLQNKRGIAYSYINKGYLSRQSEDYETALHYFKTAISLRETFSDSVGIASANLEIAKTLFLMGETDSAMQYFQESLHRHIHLDNRSYMAYSMQGIGDVYFAKQQYDSASVYFNEALVLCVERNNLSGIIDSKLGIAKTYAAQGETDTSISILNEARERAKDSELGGNILKVYRALGELYDQQKEYQLASENYQTYIEVCDSLFSVLQFQALDEIKSRFQITEQLNSAHENLKAKQKTQIYAYVIIAMLIVFAVILFLRNKTIAKLSADLAESNEAKDKIFSIISHDLVSPFHVLLGASDLLMESLDEKDIENAKNHSYLLKQTSEEAYRFISNLLAWSRTQQKSIKLRKQEFNFSKLVRDVKAMFDNQAKLKNIEVKVEVPDNFKIKADKNLLQIVLVNLLNNAVKFTNHDGEINLSLTVDDDDFKFVISDNGVGISAERLAGMFTDAKVESTLGTRNEKGTGFGLILCKEFVEMHSGEIHVKSGEGEGAEFWFTLPLQ